MPEKEKKRRGRPAGSKNKKTLQREARELAVLKARDVLKGIRSQKKGDKVDVQKICSDLDFCPITEAIILHEEYKAAEPLSSEARKQRLRIIEVILPYVAPKQKATEDGPKIAVPTFNIQINGQNVNPGTPPSLPEPKVVEAEVVDNGA